MQQRESISQLDTLNEYCQRAGVHEIDFLKVDVEADELEAFKDA